MKSEQLLASVVNLDVPSEHTFDPVRLVVP